MVSEVYNEDNMIGMARYPDKFFDLAIIDPPYGIDINMNMGRRKGERPRHKVKDWDDSIPKPEYFVELSRVSKNQIIWGGNYFPLPLTKSWIFWDKEVPDGVSFADGELAWTSFDKTLVKAKIRYTGFNGLDIGGKIHPTQKPIQLYKWLLKNYAQPGDKILDTHMGSQSSRIAAFQMGFDYYGWELDPDYFEAGNKRFTEQTAQQSLFK
jgi:site-specific DNA-methyltransferase (adenine-specific)